MITKEDEGKRGFLIKPPILRELVDILYVDKARSFVRFVNKNKTGLIENRLHSFEQGGDTLKVGDTIKIHTDGGFYHANVTARYVGREVFVGTYIDSHNKVREHCCRLDEMEFTRGH
mgnify:FL=1